MIETDEGAGSQSSEEEATDERKKASEEIRDSAHRIWLAGLGAMAVAEQEGSKFFKKLVEKGAELESRTKDNLKDVRAKTESQMEKFGDSVDERMAAALERFGVPSRGDIERLTERVEELSKKVDAIKASRDTASG